MLSRAALCAGLVAAAMPCLAKDKKVAPDPAAWDRVQAARALSRLDLPHRIVAEIETVRPDGTTELAVEARAWWSDKTRREERKGPDGDRVLAVKDGTGWSKGGAIDGLASALSYLKSSKDPPSGFESRVTKDGAECVSWKRKDGTRMQTCVRDGVVVAHEQGGRRWEPAGFAPLLDRRVPRTIVLSVDGRREATVRILELEALTSGPGDVLEGRPEDAIDYGCSSDIEPPVLVRRTEPEYPQADLARLRGGTVVIEAVIDTKGAVTRPKVLDGSGNARIDRAVVTAVQQWLYRPATCDGAPRAVFLLIRCTFRAGSG